jgi:hypothetical protein
MSLIFCDSFNHYATSELSRKYNYINPGPTVAAVTIDAGGRNGNGLKLSAGSTTSSILVIKNFDSSYSTLIASFAINSTVLGAVTSNYYFFQYRASSVHQIGLRLLGDNTIGVYTGTNTLLGTTNVSIGTNQWHYLEFKVVFGASGSFELRIDGINRASASSVNTGSASNSIYFLGLANGTAATQVYYISDLVVVAGDATSPNNFLGDVKVSVLRPTADSVINTDWSVVGTAAKYDAVNDLVSDDDTSYLLSSVPTAKQSFTFEDIAGSPSILGVQIVVTARKEESGDHNLSALTRIGGTNYTHPSIGALTTAYLQYCFPMGLNPATSGAWSVSDVNAAEYGVELQS